jgi:membrane protease subunit HflK
MDDEDTNQYDSNASHIFKIIICVIIFLFAICSLWGSFYRVSPGYQAVIFRLGNVIAIEGNGIHFKVPFIDDYYKVNTGNVRRLEFGYRSEEKDDKTVNVVTEESAKESKMLTTDGKIIEIDFVTQFQISDPEKYIINLPKKEENKEILIRNVSEACFREIVAKTKLDDILTTGKDTVQILAADLTQKKLDELNTGIRIISMPIQDVFTPKQVQEAFDNVNTAKAKSEQRVLEAQQYKNQRLASAEGDSQKIINDAKAYSSRIISVTEGDYNRIHAMVPMYKKNPQLVKSSLYIDAATEFWPKAKVIIIDNNTTLNMLPIDKMFK